MTTLVATLMWRWFQLFLAYSSLEPIKLKKILMWRWFQLFLAYSSLEPIKLKKILIYMTTDPDELNS